MTRIALIILSSVALLGFSYFIDGEAELAEQVRASIEAWLELDETLEFEELDVPQDAESIIRLGDEAKFGPDLLSLTSQTQDEKRQTIVLIAPSELSNQRVLRHEVGLLLDLALSDQGIMNPAVLADDSAELSEIDAETLNATVNAVKEDINRDGVVDYYDLVALAQAFGTSNFGSPSDLNEDGVVNRTDLSILQEAYTFSPPSVNPPNSSPEVNNDPIEELLEPAPNPFAETEEETPGSETVEEDSLEAESDETPVDENQEVEPSDESSQTDEGSSEGETENNSGSDESEGEANETTPSEDEDNQDSP